MLHLFTLAASQWYIMYYEIVINITIFTIQYFVYLSCTPCLSMYMLFIMLILSSLSS